MAMATQSRKGYSYLKVYELYICILLKLYLSCICIASVLSYIFNVLHLPAYAKGNLDKERLLLPLIKSYALYLYCIYVMVSNIQS